MSGGQTNKFGISNLPTATLSAKVKDLGELNERVRAVYDSRFLVGNIIFGASGTNKLDGIVKVICRVITSEIHMYRRTYEAGTLPAASMRIKPETLDLMQRIMEQLVLPSAATSSTVRMNKLAVFFSALVIEPGVFSMFLPKPTASGDLANGGSDPLYSTDYLEKRALILFAQEVLKPNFARIIDGSNGAPESFRPFIEECVAGYARYLPAYLPVELADRKRIQRGAAQK